MKTLTVLIVCGLTVSNLWAKTASFNVSASNLDCYNATLELLLDAPEVGSHYDDHVLEKRFNSRSRCLQVLVSLMNAGSPTLKMVYEHEFSQKNGFRYADVLKGNPDGSHGTWWSTVKIQTLTTSETIIVHFHNHALTSSINEVKDVS